MAGRSWIHYAHVKGQSSQPGEAPPDLSVCVLALAFRRDAHKVAVNEPAEPENFSSYKFEPGKGHLRYFVVPVVGATALATEKVYVLALCC